VHRRLRRPLDARWAEILCTEITARPVSPIGAALSLGELRTIRRELSTLRAVALPAGWQTATARAFGIKPSNLAECFFDIDDEPLLERLIGLCERAIEHSLPILFQ
jgi:hypothetical protein